MPPASRLLGLPIWLLTAEYELQAACCLLSMFLEMDQTMQVEYSAVFTWPVTYVPRPPYVVVTCDCWGVVLCQGR